MTHHVLPIFSGAPEIRRRRLFRAYGFCLSFAVLLLTGAGVCFVHAFLPGCFSKTGSAIVGRLHDKMIRSRKRRPQNARRPDRPMASFDYVI